MGGFSEKKYFLIFGLYIRYGVPYYLYAINTEVSFEKQKRSEVQPDAPQRDKSSEEEEGEHLPCFHRQTAYPATTEVCFGANVERRVYH